MENYKSRDAWKFFHAGWVQQIVHVDLGNDVLLMKAEVKPSWKTTNKNHLPWIAVKMDGRVLTGHCSCMAGLVLLYILLYCISSFHMGKK